MLEGFKEVQDMLEQAKELVKTLENKYNELSKPKNVRWRAEKDERYYLLSNEGFIGHNFEDSRPYNNYQYNAGNYFKTKEEAEQHKNYLIITQKLKDIALRLNNGVEIDWNKSTPKYTIFYRHLENTYRELLVQGKVFNVSYLNGIYCLSDKFLETCIKEIGEKELIEYIKGC